MTPAPSFAPTICAFHLGFGLVWDILDPSPFRIDNAGVTTVGEPIDYETTPSYIMTVTIREPGTPLTESNEPRDVAIAIINVDEPGEVTLSSQNPARNTPFTAALTDPDGSVVIDRWTGKRPPDPGNGHNGTGSLTPTDEHRGTPVRATAHYQDGHGATKSAHATTSGTVHNRPQVFIQPESDQPA